MLSRRHLFGLFAGAAAAPMLPRAPLYVFGPSTVEVIAPVGSALGAVRIWRNSRKFLAGIDFMDDGSVVVR